MAKARTDVHVVPIALIGPTWLVALRTPIAAAAVTLLVTRRFPTGRFLTGRLITGGFLPLCFAAGRFATRRCFAGCCSRL